MTPKGTALMQAEVATTERRDLVIPDGSVGLSGSFDQDDMTVPACTLVQPMSKEKGEPGKFWFPDGRAFDNLSVVVLKIAATRTLMGDLEADEGVLCKSNDRTIGYTEVPLRVVGSEATAEGPMYIPCIECPHFEDNQFERGELCKKGYTLLCYETTENFPFIFYARGAAVSRVRNRIASPALARFQQTGAASPWRFSYEWKPLLITKNFKYWVPEILISGELDEDDQARYAAMSRQLSGATSEDDSPLPTHEG